MTNVHLFRKLFEEGVQRSSAEKWFWKIREIHKKPSVVEFFFSCRHKSIQLYKEGLRFNCFHGEFLENVQTGFFTRAPLDSCFYSFNLTIQSYYLRSTFFIKCLHRCWRNLSSARRIQFNYLQLLLWVLKDMSNGITKSCFLVWIL